MKLQFILTFIYSFAPQKKKKKPRQCNDAKGFKKCSLAKVADPCLSETWNPLNDYIQDLKWQKVTVNKQKSSK